MLHIKVKPEPGYEAVSVVHEIAAAPGFRVRHVVRTYYVPAGTISRQERKMPAVAQQAANAPLLFVSGFCRLPGERR